MKKNIFLTIVFVFILVLPALDMVFNFSPIKELFEKRLPAERPEFPKNFSEAKNYPKKFEKFFDDNYGMRKSFVVLNSRIMDKIFNESPDARAVIGKDGWLFFDNYNSLLDASGMATISDKLIERGVESFGKNWRKMRDKNINYLVVIAADKSSIYPEFLPDYIKVGDSHRVDKFITALKKKYPDFPILDLRPVLKKAKEKEIIYQKTDTHWNRRGAYAAYVEIMKMLIKNDVKKKWTDQFQPRPRSDFIDKANEFIRGDISDIMSSGATNLNYDLTPKFEKSFYSVEVSKEDLTRFHRPLSFAHRNKNLPILFSYKDSFFGDLTDFIYEHFSYGFEINEFPCDLNYEIIKKYRPDVVIHEFWEGRTEAILKECKPSS